jgi:hypothetical protein
MPPTDGGFTNPMFQVYETEFSDQKERSEKERMGKEK